MSLRRGLHDEGHSGEIDPGVQEVWAGTTLVGYVWVNRHPDSNPTLSTSMRPNTKFVLLSDKYPTPGFPNNGRNPDVMLRFKWINTQMPLQAAITNLKQAAGGTATCTFNETKTLVMSTH